MRRLLALSALTVAASAAAASAATPLRPGYVTGTAKTECGKPLSSFAVSAYGFDGQPNVYPTGLPPLGTTTGHAGRYALQTVDSIRHVKPVDALVRAVEAQTDLTYGGHHYVLGLYPTDGKPDGVGPSDFSGQSGKGIVRNFVLRTSGLKPGASPENAVAGTYYGGNITLVLSLGTAPVSLTVTLVPTAPLADGCPAKKVVRVVKLGANEGNNDYNLYNIPLGFYTMSARLDGAGSRALGLQVYGTSSTGTSVPMRFLPTSEFPDASSAVLVTVS